MAASGHRPARAGSHIRPEAKAVARTEDLIATGGKDGSVMHTGFLIKQGRLHKTWHQRWFELTPNAVRYFRVRPNHKAVRKGILKLNTLRDVGRPGDSGIDEPANGWPRRASVGSDCQFAMVTTTRTYFCMAPNAYECKRWVDMLRAVLADRHARKAGERGELASPPDFDLRHSVVHHYDRRSTIRTVADNFSLFVDMQDDSDDDGDGMPEETASTVSGW